LPPSRLTRYAAIDPARLACQFSHPLRLQIDVAVNATEAGIIKEFFVNEEDTVTVGQDLVRVELGGEKPESSGEAEKPKKEESSPQASESKPAAEPEQPKSQPAPSESKSEKPAPSPKKTEEQPQKKSQPESAASSSSQSTPGNREERRVGFLIVPILTRARLIEDAI
jgi:2-oxoglutarate dehydrogenase E2 component (dihydrolipoamide succinyltransferase)